MCMGWRVDPTHNSLHDFCDRLLPTLFSCNASICFWNDSYFHTASLYCVLPNTSPAVRCNRWGLAALTASDGPPAPWVKRTVITLPQQNATWDFKGFFTEENIFQVLKDSWEDLQNNPSTVLKFISHCIASVFQRTVSLLLFWVEINQRCHSGSGLNLAEVNGKTWCCFFLNFGRLYTPAQMAFSPYHSCMCVPVTIPLRSPLSPCTSPSSVGNTALHWKRRITSLYILL